MQESAGQIQQFVGQIEEEQQEAKSRLDREIAEKQLLAAEKRQLSQEVGHVQAQLQCAEEALHEKERQLNQYWSILEIQPNELRLDGKILGEGSYGGEIVSHSSLDLNEVVGDYVHSFCICSSGSLV